jgi:protein-tyrosine phosphatase
MEDYNLRNLQRIIPGDPEGKVSLLLAHVDPVQLGGRTLDVADPWYTRDFEAAYSDIDLGCRALLAELS